MPGRAPVPEPCPVRRPRVGRLTLPTLLAAAVALMGAVAPVAATWTPGGDPIQTSFVYQPGSQLLVSDGGGGVIALWSTFTGGRARRIDAFGNRYWPAPGISLGFNEFFTDAISDGAGGFIVVGLAGGNGDDIRAERYDADGNALWGAAGVTVCSANFDQRDARILPDGAGGALIFWHDLSAGNVSGQRLNAAGVPLWTPNGVSLGFTGGVDFFSATSDGQGGAVLLAGPQQASCALQRIDSDGHTLWPTGGISFSPTDPIGLEFAGDGGAIAIWLSWEGEDVYRAQRYGATGQPLWPVAGVRFSDVTGQEESHFEPDGAGGLWAVWSDSRVAYYASIYAQHLDGSGARLLGHAGREISTGPNSRGEISIGPGPEGGLLMVWGDGRNLGVPGRGFDLYAQRIDADGTPLWESGGAAVCTAAAHQSFPSLLPDGSGGAFIFWSDIRSNPNVNRYEQGDLYATRIGGGGAVAAVGPSAREPAGLLARVTPNPSRGQGWLIAQSRVDGTASLGLFDIAGRRLFERRVELEAGRELRLALDLVGGDGAALPAGTYFYRLETAGAAASGKLVLRP